MERGNSKPSHGFPPIGDNFFLSITVLLMINTLLASRHYTMAKCYMKQFLHEYIGACSWVCDTVCKVTVASFRLLFLCIVFLIQLKRVWLQFLTFFIFLKSPFFSAYVIQAKFKCIVDFILCFIVYLMVHFFKNNFYFDLISILFLGCNKLIFDVHCLSSCIYIWDLKFNRDTGFPTG